MLSLCRFSGVFAACSLVFLSARAEEAGGAALRLPAVIGSHMVLQEGQPNTLWGWALEQTPVAAEFLDAEGKVLAHASAAASAEGKWSLELPPLAPGAAGSLRITAGTAVRTAEDVVAGEAWLCGGQSNMTYDFGADNIPKPMLESARKQASDAQGAIRFFVTQTVSEAAPQEESRGEWMVVNAENLGRCSCVAWYFAVALREQLHRPMGMVVCAVGGTRAEQWMSQAAIEALPFGKELERRYLQDAAARAPKIKEWEDADAAWRRANPTPELQARNSSTRPVRRVGPAARFAEFYNGMLHGLAPYGVKGVIWFQADGNLGSTHLYGELIKGLITSWRAEWKAELPFYYVEMNNMRDHVQTAPVKYNELSLLRERQDAALALPQVDVVSSIDCGLPEPEPHFPKKEPVGRRLALLALDHLYQFPCACHSPTYVSSQVEGHKMRIHFKYAEGLRAREGGEMRGFALRGPTGDHWVWARATIDGEDVILSSDDVPAPVAARYAWAANPVTSMENGAGLPMRPFRTDMGSPE